MTFEADVAIVGAGAAGIAAARILRARSVDIVVLEARDRIGGRAESAGIAQGFSVDRGCGWLHSADRNPLVPLIEKAGLQIFRPHPDWQRQTGDVGFRADDQRAFTAAFDGFETRLEAAAKRGEDGPAACYFEAGNRWNPLMDAVSSYYNGTEYDHVSILDYAAYADSGVNWRIIEGYGTAIEALGRELDVALGCIVRKVGEDASGIFLVTTQGMLRTRCVILTLPTAVLASGDIELPRRLDAAVAAAAALPLGLANKAFLGIDDPRIFQPDGHLFGCPDRTETGSYHLRPFGRPYVEVYVGGRHARALEAEGPGAIQAFAIEELGGLLGSGVARKLHPLAETLWGAEPFSRGSYSHALPGKASARATLAAPIDGRFFFAGEATHPTAFSTAHGAWESGERAAREVLQTLGRQA